MNLRIPFRPFQLPQASLNPTNGARDCPLPTPELPQLLNSFPRRVELEIFPYFRSLEDQLDLPQSALQCFVDPTRECACMDEASLREAGFDGAGRLLHRGPDRYGDLPIF
jgi:hypothetical protein